MPIQKTFHSFMKTGIIHDDHAFSFKAWNERVFAPVIEYIAIDVFLKVIKRKKHLFIQSTDDIGTFFSLPIVAINTRFTYRCVAIRTNSFSLKATLIHIDNGIALLLKMIKLILIYRSFYWTRFWMFQGLFFG